jgi:hypothetical protein
MDSIAEVLTPDQTIYLLFDDTDQDQIQEVEKCLTEMAYNGMVYNLTIQARH